MNWRPRLSGSPKSGERPRARLLGNHRSMVRSGYKKNRLNADFEQKLASGCSFDPEWREWRTGTKAEFAARFHQQPSSEGQQERRTDIPLVPEPGKQLTGTQRLASLKMTTQLSNSGEHWWIGFDLICRASDGLGVKRGDIQLRCGEAIAEESNGDFIRNISYPIQT